MQHVPYKGISNAMTDLLGGHIDMQFPAEFSWIAPSGRGLLTAYMMRTPAFRNSGAA